MNVIRGRIRVTTKRDSTASREPVNLRSAHGRNLSCFVVVAAVWLPRGSFVAREMEA